MTRMRMGRNEGTTALPGDIYIAKRKAIFEQVTQRRRTHARSGVTHVRWVQRVWIFFSGGLIGLASFLWLSIPYNVIFVALNLVLPDTHNGIDIAKWVMMTLFVPYMFWLVLRFMLPAQTDIRQLYGEKSENDHFVQIRDIADLVAVRRKQATSEVTQLMRRIHA